ncbi:MAG: phage tail tip lysozyme [Sphingomonas aquatilis]|uniref:phage tail tip lysozyme n=1 Tax=Sphingomonas aquatilis TaxID=93063 RepID=UPI002F32A0E3
MSQPKVAIDITANDRTEKGARSAEKRLGTVPKHVSAVTRNQDRAMREGLGRSSRSALRTLGQVEQASARVFGGRSVTSGFATRLGAIREAAAATGTGLGEAAGSASMLGSTLGVLGTVAGATVGVLAAAGFAAFKMADGWAKGAAAVGRMADTMGVARKEMQEFAAASERMGVDKGAATGGLASLSQTLNDARYGRNTGALAMLSKLGVKMQLNDDGTVNVGAMLPAIADAIARQNSSGRRTAASALGLSDALIPVFSQGGKALGDDMKDAGNTAYIASDDDIKRGQRIQRKGAMVGQLTDRAMAIAGSAAADAAEPGYDASLAAGRQIVGGATTFGGVVKNTFAPAAGLIERGGRAIERAAGNMAATSAGVRGAGRFSPGQIAALARKATPIAAEAKRYGFTDAEAQGIASNIVLESGGNHRARERGASGAGRGLIQWTDKARKAEFRRVVGVDVEQSSRDQQWRFLRYELSHREKAGWRRAMANGQHAPSIASGFARWVERPADPGRDSAERAAVAEAMTVNLHVTGLPKGAAVTATSRRGSRPAISHAVAH